MDKIDEIMKEYLNKKTKGACLERTPDCPDEAVLVEYLSRPEGAKEIQEHVAGCPFCLEQLASAQEVVKLKAGDLPKATGEAVARAKALTGSGPTKPKVSFLGRLKKNKWLLGAIVAFILSFLVPRYFLQFLVATLIMGGKWVFDTESAKTLIMIYNAWKKGDDETRREVIDRLKTGRHAG